MVTQPEKPPTDTANQEYTRPAPDLLVNKGVVSHWKEERKTATVASRYSLLGVGLLVAGLTVFGVPSARADLFVSSDNNNTVLQYDQYGAGFRADFGGGLPVNPRGVLWGPDGNLYVASDGLQAIVRYDSSGNLIDYFVQSAGELDGPRGIIFDPNGNLYVSSESTNSVERYDRSGNYLGSFVPSGSGGLSGPQGLLFGPDGNLYVASFDTAQVLRYDGTTGAFLNVFADTVRGLSQNVNGFVFGPDGNLYVSTGSSGNILRYDANGNFTDVFVQSGTSSLGDPNGLVFGPGGNLFVCDLAGTGGVLRFDGQTGDFIDAFATPDTAGFTTYLTFTKTDPVTLNYIKGDQPCALIIAGVFGTGHGATEDAALVDAVTIGEKNAQAVCADRKCDNNQACKYVPFSFEEIEGKQDPRTLQWTVKVKVSGSCQCR